VFFVVLGMCHVAVSLFCLGLDLYIHRPYFSFFICVLVPCPLMVDKFFEVMKFIAVVKPVPML
jgi:hypothetical protein